MTEPDRPDAPTGEHPDNRALLYLLLRDLSASVDRLAADLLHREQTTADLDRVAAECAAMSAALGQFAATQPGGPTIEQPGE